MIKKQLYETPETELFEVRFEGNFCGTNERNGGIPDITETDVEDDSDSWS